MSLQCDNLSGELQDQWSSSIVVVFLEVLVLQLLDMANYSYFYYLMKSKLPFQQNNSLLTIHHKKTEQIISLLRD